MCWDYERDIRCAGFVERMKVRDLHKNFDKNNTREDIALEI